MGHTMTPFFTPESAKVAYQCRFHFGWYAIFRELPYCFSLPLQSPSSLKRTSATEISASLRLQGSKRKVLILPRQRLFSCMGRM